ncbi:MAG: dTDP-glucose 4,6-dehydratase [Bacteroidetes bacterium ADurb.BinA104]|nr:MAG: dTDP-glucose 4,6-dehydratase [Bacteroidetes bacterium ADurb.BinA104]
MILIVGGSGFIGTRICRRLENDKVQFTIIDKIISRTFPERTVQCDIRNLDDLSKKLRGDVIINLAAEHRDDITPRSLYDEVNVQGAKNVCEAAERNHIDTIIFTSSVAVYGFAPIGTDETGEIHYFNDYGRTKSEAEKVYKSWFEKDAEHRKLVIVRPTVVFGEQNRGNVYNLLKQISSSVFMMVGSGKNIKSMAYVENVAAFLEYALSFGRGFYLYNYVDKPDFDMNTLVRIVYDQLCRKPMTSLHLPYWMGYTGGKLFDLLALISHKKLTISSIRIKKFCENTCFNTSVAKTGFKPPVSIEEGIRRTIQYEFLNTNKENELFYTE